MSDDPFLLSRSHVCRLPCSSSTLPQLNTNLYLSKQTPSCLHYFHSKLTTINNSSFYSHCTLALIITLANTTLNPIITSSYIITSDHYPIFTNINVHPNPPPPPTTFTYRRINDFDYPKLLMTSIQILSSQTRPAACPTYSIYIPQTFAHYLFITPLSSSKPINPLAVLPVLGLPLKSSRPPTTA